MIQLIRVLALYDQDVEQKGMAPSHQKLKKTMVKIFLDRKTTRRRRWSTRLRLIPRFTRRRGKTAELKHQGSQDEGVTTNTARVTGTPESILNLCDPMSVTLRFVDVLVPSDSILESLCIARIRESDQLQTVLALYDQDTEENNLPPSYQKQKTMVKNFLDQKGRSRNFEARNERTVTGTPAKSKSKGKSVSVEKEDIGKELFGWMRRRLKHEAEVDAGFTPNRKIVEPKNKIRKVKESFLAQMAISCSNLALLVRGLWFSILPSISGSKEGVAIHGCPSCPVWCPPSGRKPIRGQWRQRLDSYFDNQVGGRCEADVRYDGLRTRWWFVLRDAWCRLRGVRHPTQVFKPDRKGAMPDHIANCARCCFVC